MAGNKRKNKKKAAKPTKLGLLGDDLDTEIDFEDAAEYLGANIEEDIENSPLYEEEQTEIEEDSQPEENNDANENDANEKTEEIKNTVSNNGFIEVKMATANEPDEFFSAEDLGSFKPKNVDQTVEIKKEDPKPKNFFDMDDDDPDEIVKQEDVIKTQQRERFAAISKRLDSIFDDEEEAVQESAVEETAPEVENEDIFAELREAVKNKEHEKIQVDDLNEVKISEELENKMAGAYALDMEGELIPDNQLDIMQELRSDSSAENFSQGSAQDDDDIVVEDATADTPEEKEVVEDAVNLEDVAVGGENDPNEVTIENETSDRLLIHDFYGQFARRIDNQTVARQVKNELSDIVKAAGVKDADKTSEVVGEAYNNILDSLRNVYDPEAVKMALSDVVTYVFGEAYDSLYDVDLSPKDKLITAQKIADVMLKNYSPVTFANGEIDQYAENYVINSRTILKERLKIMDFPENEIDPLVEEIKEALARGFEPEIEKPTEQEIKGRMEQLTWERQNNGSLEGHNPRRYISLEELNKEIPEGMYESVAGFFDEKIDDGANIAVFMQKINAFGKMYKIDVNANNFAFYTSEAWTLLKSGDEKKIEQGQKMLSTLMQHTLKPAFDVERSLSYNEHRLPDYIEITKSANELLRSAMFAFTDLYHEQGNATLFESTAFGGLNEREIATLTQGDSLWKMDQKSDAAWELQSREAKSIADKWLAEDRPYEKMISEMKAIVAEDQKGIVPRKELLDKLTAAEWMLINNEKMMVDDPEDPLNPIPNWGNRYWKALAEARESLGIDKHTSMRDMIQADYAASAKAVNSLSYNRAQIRDYVLDKGAREIYDSMELQKEQFATQSAAVILTEPQKDKKKEEPENTAVRIQITVKSEDQRMIMKNEPKNYNFQIERGAELQLNTPNQNR